MELENNAAKQTYIRILTESLTKKINVLDELLVLSKKQETILNTAAFDEQEFMNIVNLKDGFLLQLDKLDQGFEQIYQSIQQELMSNKNLYQNEINRMKELIVKLTEKSVQLQALEKRNKTTSEVVFSRKRQEIGQSRMSNRQVTNYYKNMAEQRETQSFFYDKKK